jgi:hypothetical protein
MSFPYLCACSTHLGSTRFKKNRNVLLRYHVIFCLVSDSYTTTSILSSSRIVSSVLAYVRSQGADFTYGVFPLLVPWIVFPLLPPCIVFPNPANYGICGRVIVSLAIPPSSGPPRYHADNVLPGLAVVSVGLMDEVTKKPPPPSPVAPVTTVPSFPTYETLLFVNIMVFPLSPEPAQVSSPDILQFLYGG